MLAMEYCGIQRNGYKDKMKRYIIITSIFKSTEAVDAFSKLDSSNTIVVGDKKSPAEYNNNRVNFLSVENQTALGYALSKDLPFNHYCRKNIGYLYAIKTGADLIIDTDDDNIPYSHWSFPDFDGEFDLISSGLGFINIYALFTEQDIWPRGLPLNKIRSSKLSDFYPPCSCKVGIWQGLVDGDPDVDAIYRLLSDTPCIFNKRKPIVLGKGTISPFNTQNTAFRKELFPLLYIPATVTFRFTDILRSYVAQPIMWLYNYYLGFTGATVKQVRNPHDYMKDFESEIPCFLQGEEVLEIVSRQISSSYSICDNLTIAYEELYKHGIVEKKEMSLVNSWINDLQ
jgi:hypothetical protein